MDKIYVVDFGGQYTHLITNRIRSLNVLAQIRHPEDSIDQFEFAKGLIFSGGPNSVYDEDTPFFNKELLDIGVPILGLCFGLQLIVNELGGKVKPGYKEYGVACLNVTERSGIFSDLSDQEQVWMSHGDSVVELPDGFKSIGATQDCPCAAMSNEEKKMYGFQFHPEVSHTPNGMRMLENFVDICDCRREWTTKGYLNEIKESLRTQIGDKKVFMLVSGGVDSTVAFTLLNEVLGKTRVLGLNIDNGFCRKGEVEAIKKMMSEHNYDNLLMEDHSDTFLGNLEGIVQPEEKRKIIGNTFIEVSDSSLRKLNLNPDEWLLGQGTIYPDTIESGGTKNSALIKTHHNRVELIEDLIKKGLVVEPLSGLYKDEVRALGLELGLPEDMVWRHPFPGPGLAVRTLCSFGEEDGKLDMLTEDSIGFCREKGLEVDILPVKSVGVQGDSRSYAHPAVVYGKKDWQLLEDVSTYLTNKHNQINRVVVMLAPSQLPLLKLKKSHLSKDRLDMLREVDAVVMRFLHDKNLTRIIWQMPTVMLPLSSDGKKECVVLRPVITRDFMTARFAEIVWNDLDMLTNEIMKFDFVDALFYDITHKPPGTIEWE